jgi:AcrR family transcriptional regulator
MDAVAAAAERNKATLYHYFSSKAELLHAIYVETARIALATIRSVPEDLSASVAIRRLIRENLEIAAARPNETAVYFHEVDWIEEWLPPSLYQEAHATEVAYFAELRNIVARGFAAGEFGNLDQTVSVQLIAGAIAWASRSHESHSQPVADVADRLADAVLGGLSSR